MTQLTNTRAFPTVLATSRLRVFAFLFPAGALISLLTAALPATAGEIHDAVRAGDAEKVKAMLAKSPELANSLDDEGNPPLCGAADEDELAIAKLLIDHRADVRAANRRSDSSWNGLTALHAASSAAMVRLLLARGADANAKGPYGRTPLSTAADDCNVEVAKALLEGGAAIDFDSAVKLGWVDKVASMLKEKPWLAKPPRQPLHDAARNGDVEMARLLLMFGADPNWEEKNNFGGSYTALSAAYDRGHYDVAEVLLENGADPRVVAYLGKGTANLLHLAVRDADTSFVKLLLNHGADVNDNDFEPDFALDRFTPLHSAAFDGNLEKARLLLEYRADVNAETGDGATPLFLAMAADKLTMVELLLQRGARLDFYTAAGINRADDVRRMLKADPSLARSKDRRSRRTALHWAARNGHLEICRQLLEHGAAVNAEAPEVNEMSRIWPNRRETATGETPLHLAAEAGRTRVAQLLIAKGANLKAADWYASTPLHRAAAAGQSAIAKLLTASGAGVNAVNNALATPLHIAAAAGHIEVTKILTAAGATVDAKNSQGYTPLHSAVDNRGMVELLLNAGADVNAVADETTPLYLAAYKGSADAARVLLERGGKVDLFSACVLGRTADVAAILTADPRRLDAEIDERVRKTPIAVAAEHGHLEIVRWLAERGAKPSSAEAGYSAMHLAAENGHRQIVHYFCKMGVSVDARDSAGRTPLHAAAIEARPHVVRYLLDRKADVAARDKSRETPLHDACSDPEWYFRFPSDRDRATRDRHRLETVQRLIEAGADVHATDKYGSTPLHKATRIVSTDVAAFLLSKGADVNARTRHNETPLALAERQQKGFALFGIGRHVGPVIALLRQHGGKR